MGEPRWLTKDEGQHAVRAGAAERDPQGCAVWRRYRFESRRLFARTLRP
jgi:hypothetical protein